MTLMEEKKYKMVEGETLLSTIKKYPEYRVLTRCNARAYLLV